MDTLIRNILIILSISRRKRKYSVKVNGHGIFSRKEKSTGISFEYKIPPPGFDLFGRPVGAILTRLHRSALFSRGFKGPDRWRMN